MWEEKCKYICIKSHSLSVNRGQIYFCRFYRKNRQIIEKNRWFIAFTRTIIVLIYRQFSPDFKDMDREENENIIDKYFQVTHERMKKKICWKDSDIYMSCRSYTFCRSYNFDGRYCRSYNFGTRCNFGTTYCGNRLRETTS
jgi:hypothetical protein